MSKFYFTVLFILLLGICFEQISEGAEFTVDERSKYHFFGSAAFGASIDATLYATRNVNQFSAGQRVTIATLGGSLPGAIKESLLDGYFDYGDMTFNVTGALVGALVSEAACDWIYADGQYIGFKVHF